MGTKNPNWIKQKAAQRDHFWDFEKYLRKEFVKKVLIYKIFKLGLFFCNPMVANKVLVKKHAALTHL